MDSKSLMISDWVLVHNKPQRVAIIEETCISYWAELYMSDELLSPSLADIHPIPITPEILEKNGFKLCEYSSIEYKLHVKDGVIDYNIFVAPARSKMVIELADTEHAIFDWFVDTVHELQHAIRLCGLNELADNFKI